MSDTPPQRADMEALRDEAADEGRSVDAVAKDAIGPDLLARLRALTDEIVAEERDLLNRLAQ